jgi:hypothetical protein
MTQGPAVDAMTTASRPKQEGTLRMRVKRPFSRKTTVQRLVDTVSDQMDAARRATPSPAIDSHKAVKTGLIAAGSVAGLTAGSAAITSLRHRIDRDHGDS